MAIAVRPNYAITLNNRGNAYENKRDDDRVIQEVNQTIKNNKAPAVAYYNRANVFYGTQGLRPARSSYYDQAIKLQPSNADAFNQRCGARAMVGELEGRGGGLQRGAAAQAEQRQRVRPSRPGLSQARPARSGHRQLRRGAQAQPELAGCAVRPRRRQDDEGRRRRQQRRLRGGAAKSSRASRTSSPGRRAHRGRSAVQ